jgi:hypothetical protein
MPQLRFNLEICENGLRSAHVSRSINTTTTQGRATTLLAVPHRGAYFANSHGNRRIRVSHFILVLHATHPWRFPACLLARLVWKGLTPVFASYPLGVVSWKNHFLEAALPLLSYSLPPMKTLLALMVLAYVAALAYMTIILHRAQSSPIDISEDPKRFRKFKTAVMLATIAKFALMIGFFILFLLNYQTLRHWVGSICFLMGLETLWGGFSMLRRARTTSLQSDFSPMDEKTFERFKSSSSSLKSILRPFLFSGVLLVAATVFLFFRTNLYLCLSFWDLGGVVFFFVSNHLRFVLYVRYRDLAVEKLRKAIAPLGANLVPKEPDTP